MRMRFSDRWWAVPGVSLLEMESGMGRAVFLIFFVVRAKEERASV